MEKTRNKPKELLPYGMLLSRLFKHVVSVFLELATNNYLSFDHVMHPLAPHYERKTRSDHGKKRPRESNASSSFATQNHHSSSLSLDAMIDENHDESSHPNSSSPSQKVSSSSTVVSKVRQNPSHESHNLDTFLSKTINLQTQQRDAHQEGLRSIKQALKNIMDGKRSGSSKAPTSSKTGHSKRRKESSSTMDSNPSRPSVSTPVDTEMHKEDQQATDGLTSLGVTSEERANPQLNSDFTAEANPGLFAPNDYVLPQQGMDEGPHMIIYL
nr:hypothetical protein [Tanacetum cinerariifolium]